MTDAATMYELFMFIFYTITTFAAFTLLSTTHTSAKWVHTHISKRKEKKVNAAPASDDYEASKMFTTIDASSEKVESLPPTQEPFIRPAKEAPVRLPGLAAKRPSLQQMNSVKGETRTRKEMELYQAEVKIGKAFLYKAPSGLTQYGVYLIRVDCRTSEEEKHMNPVVMWDISVRFSSFVKLAIQMKKEIRDKKLTHVKVPTLPSKTFTRQVTSELLSERKEQLQIFLDQVTQEKDLAQLESFRVFCEAV